VGLLANVTTKNRKACYRPGSSHRMLWGGASDPAHLQAKFVEGHSRTEKTPLDLSIAKAQIGPWVFEVKYFKYTLFAYVLPAD